MLFGQEHVERYRETDGEEGYHWQKGTTILLLTTTGRKSGEERTTPLIFTEHEGDYLIVASKGGADEPPAWYLNLQEDPHAKVQVKADVFDATARDARRRTRSRRCGSRWWRPGPTTTTTRRRRTGRSRSWSWSAPRRPGAGPGAPG